jgi:hypothetical protein
MNKSMHDTILAKAVDTNVSTAFVDIQHYITCLFVVGICLLVVRTCLLVVGI